MNDDVPTCDKCGAPITTGLMAVFCPQADQCEFWVEDQREFIEELRAATTPPIVRQSGGKA